MNRHSTAVALVALAVCSMSSLPAAENPPAPGAGVKSLFDGATLSGWEGNPKLWRVEDGALTGGSYVETVKQNEFLATTRDYTNFIVRLKIKLTGTNGFINSGFQIRSQRVPNNSEMAGYQCDFGEPNWYGAIYDESRRNKLMAQADMKVLRPALHVNDWNDYVIRADGARVTTWINGVLGVDYVEQETGLPNFDWGKLGIQVHGGGKAVVQVKDISVEELPATPAGRIFRGAPEPKKGAKAEPVSPEEERARFTLAPGFDIELVVAEDLDAGIGKFVTVDWDQHGNLWTMTALEYPVDANESPAVANELYASKAKDKVLVYDRDPKAATGYASKPRVFADGLAIPLGILPYKNGVYVQHGTEIVFLSDTEGDGKADKREVILSGFGVQDSHLFPHQFTRAPGNWIWFAQGAFNYGKVKTTKGAEVQFDQTRMAKFRPDGSEFEITSQGPCNIWGLHMTMEGETWIQEANDFGYPAMPFHEYANYPGCSGGTWKSYAPEFPGTAPHFQMGGTGLSGLAMTDGFQFEISHLKSQIRSWPEAYCDVIYIANPITRKIQAIKARRDGGRYALTKLPDFIQSSDEMFRPVALRLGPDGCLYVVDWYNKIISHNEVARNHPDRDKKRGRIWRVKHQDVKPLDVPDFTKLSGEELLAKLGGENTTQSHLAWQAIGDRGMKELAPKLKGIVSDKSQAAARRIAALWAVESLDADQFNQVSEFCALLLPLCSDAHRNVRREAVRVLGSRPLALVGQSAQWNHLFDALAPLASDPEPEVRAELIKTVASLASVIALSPETHTSEVAHDRALPLLLGRASPSLAEPTMKSTQSGKVIKAGTAYDREFERYLVRLLLERHPAAVERFLDSEPGQALSVEARIFAALCIEPKRSVRRIANLLHRLQRPIGSEELLRLAMFPEVPGVADSLTEHLVGPQTSALAVDALLALRTRIDAAKLRSVLETTAATFLDRAEPTEVERGIRLARAFQLGGEPIESFLVDILKRGWISGPRDQKLDVLQPQALAALHALRELKSGQVDLFATLVKQGGAPEQDAAVAALAASRNVTGPQQLARLYPTLSAATRRTALASLPGTKAGAQALVNAVSTGAIPKDELDGATLDKLQAVLGNDPDLAALMQDMASFFRPALRLNGEDNAWSETDITLAGAFTVETWVKLDVGIDNNDGILGAAGVIDMNFFGSQFRVWIGGGVHDAIVAKKKTIPDVWTHIAVTRDTGGIFRIFQNGELDAAQGKPSKGTFDHLRLGWTGPAKGTAGWLSEYRVWSRARSAEEIRADFDRSYESEIGNLKSEMPSGLVHQFSGTNWGKLHGGAKVLKTSDFPPLLTPAESKTLAEKFNKFHTLAEKAGDLANGKALFTTVCMGCHSVGGQGGQVGPVLNGAGALGVEALLRNILTPNAAMEPGYRVFRVELKDGDVLDGIRVSEDKDAIVLRRQNMDDARIPQATVRKASFTRTSIMPEGLLDGMKPQEVSDLFSYLKTLR